MVHIFRRGANGTPPQLDCSFQGRPQGRLALAPGRDLGVENKGEAMENEGEVMEDQGEAMEDQERVTEDEE